MPIGIALLYVSTTMRREWLAFFCLRFRLKYSPILSLGPYLDGYIFSKIHFLNPRLSNFIERFLQGRFALFTLAPDVFAQNKPDRGKLARNFLDRMFSTRTNSPWMFSTRTNSPWMFPTWTNSPEEHSTWMISPEEQSTWVISPVGKPTLNVLDCTKICPEWSWP